MTLSQTRIAAIGETPYSWERDAIDFAINGLPNTDPYYLWALAELLDPTTGRLYEIDMMILGYAALYLIEVKSGPGRYAGDNVDWLRTPPGEPGRWMDAPYRLTNHKAKVLRSRLQSKLPPNIRAPWVQPLVFLSADDVKLDLTPEGLIGVVTKKNFVKAITHNEFPGPASGTSQRRISRNVARDVIQAMEKIGLRLRRGKMRVGEYELGSIIHEGPGFQDRTATHSGAAGITMRARARTYPVPEQTSIERRQQLRRAADREAQLLYEVREHENVLSWQGYVSDAPLGPTVLLDAFDGGLPLDVFLRQTTDIDFLDRIDIIEQVARALAYCHRKNIFHGDVSPSSVLVRRSAKDKLEVRLLNFQLGHGEAVDATSHWSAFVSERTSVYVAPEVRDGTAPRSAVTDVFSLGCLAFFVLTGKPPGETLAEVDGILDRDSHLDPAAVSDAIPEEVAEAVQMATTRQSLARIDDIQEWIDYLMDRATSPLELLEPETDPLEARSGEVLGKDLTIIRVLGHGATSRVLEVEREGRRYALKVSLSEAHDRRLRDEAEVLRELRHPRIVQLHETLTLKDRTALLMSKAGEETMQMEIAEEGSLSLEYVSRYGEDLASVLECLEEAGVVHRDIKPANLGVGMQGKTAHRLTLFDFSLAKVPLSTVDVGTTAYRDPFLKERGSWDAAADRWSAAVTLHEALAGTRPRVEGDRVIAVSERFDPTVKESLVSFFEKAFAPILEHRFSSAKEMGRAWSDCFLTPAGESKTSSAPGAVAGEQEWDRDALAAIELGTPIAALPLSPLAIAALDRAGLTVAEDLLPLPENRLSAIRGVGRALAGSILTFRNEWVHARDLAAGEYTVMLPGYRGDDIAVGAAGLDNAISIPVMDAGIQTLMQLASSPKRHIEAIAERHGFEVARLTSLLEEENRKADERAHPSTLEGWVEALLSERDRGMRYLRRLYGLDDPFAGRLDVTVKEVAKQAKITNARVYQTLGKAREQWSEHGAIDELRQTVREIVEKAGRALRLDRGARELVSRLPHDRSRDSKQTEIDAAALLRVVAEIEKGETGGIAQVRLKGDRFWLLTSGEDGAVVKALGKVADKLAERTPLPSPGEVERALRKVVEETPLATVPVSQLVAIAAEASETSARSSRLEIYPKDISPDRLLELSAALLKSAMTEEAVRKRVAARFPDAVPLPERPELDALLQAHGLEWNETKKQYERPGGGGETSLGTAYASFTRQRTALPTQMRAMTPEALRGRELDERLGAALERRSLRVLGVPADKADEAARYLARRMETSAVSFDAVFIKALRGLMGAKNIQEKTVFETDAEGPTGKAWRNLAKLAALAADEVAGELLPPRAPLLLTQPGLIARYGLEGFLEKVVAASREDDAEAIFLLVPAHDTGGIPMINGELTVPGVLPSQVLWVSREWLGNEHNAAAGRG